MTENEIATAVVNFGTELIRDGISRVANRLPN